MFLNVLPCDKKSWHRKVKESVLDSRISFRDAYAMTNAWSLLTLEFANISPLQPTQVLSCCCVPAQGQCQDSSCHGLRSIIPLSQPASSESLLSANSDISEWHGMVLGYTFPDFGDLIEKHFSFLEQIQTEAPIPVTQIHQRMSCFSAGFLLFKLLSHT